MKTTHYNPSQIEVEFAKIIADLQEEIQKRSPGFTIEKIKNNSKMDNPNLIFSLLDTDGDKHELMVQFIQRADADI
jgi:hypothetical protein